MIVAKDAILDEIEKAMKRKLSEAEAIVVVAQKAGQTVETIRNVVREGRATEGQSA